MAVILTNIGWEDTNGELLGTWTNQPNSVREQSGITVASGVTVNTLAGNDAISGGPSDLGVRNEGTINTGNGNDSISGAVGGRGNSGISNIGTIDTGNGNDSISASVFGSGNRGISNSGKIDTGNGNDTISGVADGNSSVTGISNTGTINTGNGNDIIIGRGSSAFGMQTFGIFNSGTIDTGNGNDTVDTLIGGFSGSTGTILLGNGADILKGFGSGFFDGGNGNEDQLLFSTGTYTISDIPNIDGFYTVNNGTIDMFVRSFEFIGSASDPAATFSFSSVIGETFVV